MKYLDKNKFQYFVDTEIPNFVYPYISYSNSNIVTCVHTIKFNSHNITEHGDFKLDRLC